MVGQCSSPPLSCHSFCYHWLSSGPRLNIKTVFPRYGDSYIKDKTIGETVLFLTWESPYLVRLSFLLRQPPAFCLGVGFQNFLWLVFSLLALVGAVTLQQTVMWRQPPHGTKFQNGISISVVNFLEFTELLPLRAFLKMVENIYQDFSYIN